MSEDMPTTDEQWRERLTPEQYSILRKAGTEPAFSGEHNSTKADGVFTCAGCGEPLFESDHKFDSGSGWPSFDRPLAEQSVATETDNSHGMTRTEVRCAKCDGHLGHVFPDGPRETTGARFCINSLSLDFKPASD
ncbi:MAG: peptide-methionine (R)-S-oxide reductase MsrB [Solirubrobacterales bacterium]|jgi:peptide-methionine (R)-S-oxide reductase|nr:peptide-methionine (R)-S-oxide reductase MsrB [Solirubrobacterales bacterium]